MTPNGDGTYTYTTVYVFGTGSGGQFPEWGPILDSAGNIFVVNGANGLESGCEVISKLSNVNGTWTETILDYECTLSFEAQITLDSSDDVFMILGDGEGSGIYELVGESKRLLSTLPPPISIRPSALTLDSAGNLYGVITNGGAYGFGNVYMLPTGTYRYTDLYDFNVGFVVGDEPIGQPVVGSDGNLYGTCSGGGPYGGGTLWKLTLN